MFRLSLIGRPKTAPQHGVYQEALSPSAGIDGGAAEFVFEPLTTNPVYSYRGSGRVAGSMEVTTPGFFVLHPHGAPQGIPVLGGNPNPAEPTLAEMGNAAL